MAPLFSFIPNLTEIVQSIVHTILYRKYGEVPPDVHPAARDNFRKPCLAAIYYVIQGRVWDGKFRTKKGTWDGEPYEEDIEEYNPVSGPHPEQYLDGTPFARILDFPVPLSYTHKKRFEHTQIVGGSGAGKTTLLSHLLLHDLNNSPDPPGIVLIDPKRTVIDKLSRLALFDSKLKDRLILVSPEYAPAINIFDMSNRLSNVGAIESLVYLCSALASEFTVRQEGLAASIARLLLVFPQTLGRNATLHDFQDLLVDKFPSKYRAAVEGLRPNQRRFFEEGGFENPEYRDAKRQIRVRLDAMLNSDHLDSLFSSQKSAINIGAELQKGSIILVDTAEGLVGKRESDSFGFVFIAEVMRAIMERNALAPEARRPAFLYVDEAANFFKGDMGYFFTAARQCHVGGVFAFHTLAQTEQAGLRDALMASTATKLVSKRAVDDAPSFAYHMGFSSPTDFRAFLDGRPNYHFACSIAGVQDKAVSITAPFGEIDQEPKMSDAAYQQLIQRNRERVSGQQHQRPAAPPPPPRPPNDQDTREGVTMDDLSLADAYAQLALAIRRGDRKREAELQDHIDSFKKRTQEDDWRNKR